MIRCATPSNDTGAQLWGATVADTPEGILSDCTLEGLVRRGRPAATSARLLDIINHPCWNDGYFHDFLTVVVELNDQCWRLPVSECCLLDLLDHLPRHGEGVLAGGLAF